MCDGVVTYRIASSSKDVSNEQSTPTSTMFDEAVAYHEFKQVDNSGNVME
jgi:hypothetical protein